MILVDANILLYAHVSNYPQHQGARTCLDGALSGTTRVGLPWESLALASTDGDFARFPGLGWTNPISV